MLVSAGPVIIKAPGVATSPILKWDAAPGVEGKKKGVAEEILLNG